MDTVCSMTVKILFCSHPSNIFSLGSDPISSRHEELPVKEVSRVLGLLPFPMIPCVSDTSFFSFSLIFPCQPDYWSSGSHMQCMLESLTCHFFTLNRAYRATKELKVTDFWILISLQSIELKWTCLLKQFFLHFQIQYFADRSQGWSSATLALWIHLLFQFVYNLLNQFSH